MVSAVPEHEANATTESGNSHLVQKRKIRDFVNVIRQTIYY